MTRATTAERLLTHKRRIVNLWEKRANQEIVAARELQSLALRDELEGFLEQLAFTLKTADESRKKRLKRERTELGAKHGTQRAVSQGYVLEEVILEFHLLRQVIFEVLERDAELKPGERDVILDAIEQAVHDAAGGFSATLRDIQEHFALSLTHDLRGPLTAARAAAQLILRQPDRQPDRPSLIEKSAFRILASMDRLDQMIQDILNASRLRSGQGLAIKRSVFELDALVRDTIDEFRVSEPERFMVHSDEMIEVNLDFDGTRRVIENLIANALKYGAVGSVVTVTLEKTNGKARLTVHNEGNPIPADQQKLLFSSFRQLDVLGASSPSAKRSGWGLGLFLSKGIVEAQGGAIRVVSSPEQGTSFIVELPVSAEASLAA